MSAGKTIAVRIFAAALSVLVAFSFGFSFADVGNQATYLPPAMHSIDPGFLSHDWLISETSPYHGTFEWIVRFANAVGPTPWVLAVLNLVVTSAGIFVIFCLATTLAPRGALAVFAIVLLLLVLEESASVGGSYVFSSGLQPSSLAAVAWLFAMLQFLRNRFALSGFALSLAGLFHANFLVLGIGAFALAHLVWGLKNLPKRLLQQLAPSALVLAYFLPLLINAGAGDGAEEARRILQQIRAPHHYLPLTYLFQFWQWAGWTVMGLGAAWFVEGGALRRSTLCLLGSIGACVAGASVLTTVVFVPAVAQLFVWRLAPFGVLLSQVVIASVAVAIARGELVFEKRAFLLPAFFILAGALAVARWYVYLYPLLSAPMFAIFGTGATCFLLRFWSVITGFRVRVAAPIVTAVTVVLAVPQWAHHVKEVVRQSTLIGGGSLSSELHLYSWVKQSPAASVFLTPPDMERFRLLGERAVVVDWKSTPMLPNELLVWHRRISAVAGRAVLGVDDAIQGYRARPLAELQTIAEKFGADFVVLDRSKHAGIVEPDVPLFVSEPYIVYSARRNPE